MYRTTTPADDYLELISRPFYAEVIERFLARIAAEAPVGNRVLDLGSGAGHVARVLGSDNTVINLDVDPKFLGDRTGPAVAADMTRLPFGDRSFDMATALTALHHLGPGGLEAVVEEAARVLRPGGLFMVCEPVMGSINAVYYLGRKLMESALGPESVSRLIGYFEPDERPLGVKGLTRALESGFDLTVERWLPLRLPPLRLLARTRFELGINAALERLPPARAVGTYALIRARRR